MISVAIDGPAGAGKSTVAKRLAHKLGAMYIDTGAMYRALTYKAITSNVNTENEHELVALLLDTKIELIHDQHTQMVYMDGVNITEEIRSPHVSQYVSSVAKHPKVRQHMVEMQRAYSHEHSVVMDGRDIGTVVLPHANLKIFLTASVEERAHRRYTELLHKGYEPVESEILRDIISRDRLDSERASSPLIQAEDAILIDATHLSIDEVVDKIYSLAV